MSASTDPLDAQVDSIMETSLEELAASEGKTVEQVLEEGRRTREFVLEMIRREFPDFGKNGPDER